MRRKVLLAGAMAVALLVQAQPAHALLGGILGGEGGAVMKCTSGASGVGNIDWNASPVGGVAGSVTSSIGNALSGARDMLSDAIGSVGSFLGLTDSSGCASEKSVLVQIFQQARQLYEDIQQTHYQATMLMRIAEDPTRILDASTMRLMKQLGINDPTIYELASAARTIEYMYQRGVSNPGASLRDAERIAKIVTEHTNQASLDAAHSTAAAKESLDEALRQAGQVMTLSNGVVGQTQAIQVNTQMQRIKLSADAAQFADMAAQNAANLRVAEEMRAWNVIADQKLEVLYGPGTMGGGGGLGRTAIFE